MKTRKLGTQGLAVSEIGLGCMGMSYAYGSADENEAIATIHRALDLGIDSSTPPKCTARTRTKSS